MSYFTAAANDEDGDIIKALRAENEQLRQSLLNQHTVLEMTAKAGAHHARAAECLRETVIRWAARAEQAEEMLEAIGAGGVGKQEQSQAEQPIGCITGTYGGYPVVRLNDPALVLPFGTALYTHPQPKREPLTPDLIRAAMARDRVPYVANFDHYVALTRAIERSHEIGGEA